MTEGQRNRSGDEGPPAPARRLAELLDRQHELFARLEALSADQRRAIESGDDDGLLRALNRRQGVISSITSLNEATRPLVAWCGDAADRMPAHDRTLIQERMARLDAIVARIAEGDERDRGALESRRAAIAGELGAVSTGRRAMNAYGAGAPGGPRYQDRRG